MMMYCNQNGSCKIVWCPTSKVFGNACMTFGHAGVVTWWISLAFTNRTHQTHSMIVRRLQQQVNSFISAFFGSKGFCRGKAWTWEPAQLAEEHSKRSHGKMTRLVEEAIPYRHASCMIITITITIIIITIKYIYNQRKLGSNTSVLRTNRILRLEMMKGGRSYNNT